MLTRTRVSSAVVVLAWSVSGINAYAADAPDADRVIVLRTVEDAAVSPVPPGCPFASPNVLLGATAWSFQSRANDGTVANAEARQVGTAQACGKITTALVPFNQVPFYIEFNVEDGFFAAQGFCTITSNNIPVPGLILAGCTLSTVAVPPGVAGGSVTSNSVFNPLHLAGFDTGSIWTLRIYGSE